MSAASPHAPPSRTPFAVALLSLGALFCLLYAGALTTSIQAGMVFRDWPLSNGSLNPDGWLYNAAMRAEHSHRLLGALVGLCAIGLAVAVWRLDGRRWLVRLALWALALVVIQGLLGGLRVLLDSTLYAMVHGTFAQAVLACFFVIAAATAPRTEPAGPADARAGGWSVAFALAILVQLLIAVVLRHERATLAIPTFPLTEQGGLIPETWTFPVAIHFAHRAFAVVVCVVAVYWARAVWTSPNAALRPAAWIVGAGVLGQVALGASIIWTTAHPVVASLHVILGASLLAGVVTTGVTAFVPGLARRATAPAPRRTTEAVARA